MPSKPAAAAALTHPVSFRLTHADHAAWLAKVAASGLRPSAFFRAAVLANRTQIVAKVAPPADLARLLYVANKASNNLNQLAHQTNLAHLAGTVNAATYAAILAELKGISEALKRGI